MDLNPQREKCLGLFLWYFCRIEITWQTTSGDVWQQSQSFPQWPHFVLVKRTRLALRKVLKVKLYIRCLTEVSISIRFIKEVITC